jgi:hypothetical protein
MHPKTGPFKKRETALNTFERNILRKIYGPIRENGTRRKRYNHELYNLHEVKIKKFFPPRMNDKEPTKKLMLGKPDSTRRRGSCDGLMS